LLPFHSSRHARGIAQVADNEAQPVNLSMVIEVDHEERYLLPATNVSDPRNKSALLWSNGKLTPLINRCSKSTSISKDTFNGSSFSVSIRPFANFVVVSKLCGTHDR